MRLVTYSVGPAGTARAAVRVGHRILDIETASRVKGEPLPHSMKALLGAGRGALSRVRALAKAATTEARLFSHAMHEERAIRLLPPVPDADKFLCVTGNPRESGKPTASVRPASTLVGHDAKVACPAAGARLECAPELVFVIGRRALGVKQADAMDCVVGVTIFNNLDTGVGSLGPEIVTLDEIADPGDLWMTCAVNGEERLRANTRDHAWTLPVILEHFSRHTPIEPGDLFSTGVPGKPAGGKPGSADPGLKPGDIVECSIEGIATLRNAVARPGGG